MNGKSLKINTILNMIKSLMSILFPLITFKYAAVVLHTDGIGIVNFVVAAVGYVGLVAALGFNQYAVSRGSVFRNEKDKLQTFANEIFSLHILSTIVAYIILFILIFTPWFSEYRKYMLIYGLTIAFATIGVEWLFTIKEDFLYITIRYVVFQAVSLLLLFLFVKTENDLIWYIVLLMLSNSGSNILNFFYSKKYINLKIKFSKEMFKHLVPAITVCAAQIASIIYINSDTLILGLVKGPDVVGQYSASAKVIKAVSTVLSSLCIAVSPRLAEMLSKKDFEESKKIISKVIRILLMFMFISAVGIFIFAEESILIISGSDFLSAALSERILVADIFISAINGFFVWQILVPLHEEKKSFQATLAGSIVNIILDIILIPLLSMEGAAIATVISEMAVLFFCIKAANSHFKIYDFWKNVTNFILPAFVSAGVCIAGKIMVNNLWIRIMVFAPVALIVYFGILMLLKNEEVLSISSAIGNKIKRK